MHETEPGQPSVAFGLLYRLNAAVGSAVSVSWGLGLKGGSQLVGVGGMIKFSREAMRKPEKERDGAFQMAQQPCMKQLVGAVKNVPWTASMCSGPPDLSRCRRNAQEC